MAQIICNPPQLKCYLKTCTSCPGISQRNKHLREVWMTILLTMLYTNSGFLLIDVLWRQVSKSADNFVDAFCESYKCFFLIHSCKTAISFPYTGKIRFASWRIVSDSRLFRKLFLCASRCSPIHRQPFTLLWSTVVNRIQRMIQFNARN